MTADRSPAAATSASPPPPPAWWRAFLPARTAIGPRERWRGAIGAMLGLATAGGVGWLTTSATGTPGLPFLIAPMGASAVLLFALPASPLAQPWSILGGNLVSGAIGITCAHLVPMPLPAMALAMLLSLLAMLALRCLHPPSGAMSVITTLGGPAVQAAGYGFLLWPVTVNGLALVAVAIAWNRATGHRYPHLQRPAVLAGGEPTPARPRAHLSPEDLRLALREHDELLDIAEDDLEALVLRLEGLAHRRRLAETRCEDLMVREVVAVEFATPLDEAWTLLEDHRVTVLPVLDRTRRVLGVLSRDDLLRAALALDEPGPAARLRALLRRTPGTHSDKPEVAGQVMSAPAVTVREDQPLADLVPRMLGTGHHHLPVVDATGRLAGMLAPADVIAALAEAAPAPA